MENIISVKNVTKDFNGSKAIKDLTFVVKKGEVFGFLGPSGAGKTTTIKILTSQLLPSSGETMVLGSPAYLQKKEVLSRSGY